MSRIFLGDTDRQGNQNPQAWKAFGYNIDGIISSKSGSNHCKPIEGALKSNVQTDGLDGIDNSFGANLVPILGALAGDLSTAATEAFTNGDYTLLLRIGNYNPGADDSDLVASLYQGAPRGAPPLWNGSDNWPVTFESVNGGNLNQPKVVVDDSYVAGGTLVTSPKTSLLLALHFSGLVMPVTIHNAVITMAISGTGSSASGTTGTISGLLDTEQLVSELQKVVGAFDSSLCNSNTFESIAMQIRQASDIMSDGTNGDPGVTCNAISVGLGFEMKAVALGSVASPATPPPDPCANN